jgi:phage baseplate assembly protein W
MKRARISGWKFVHPDLEAGEKAEKAPTGMVLNGRASVDYVTDDEAVRQAVLMLLSTRPGERVMRPDYGCDLHSLLFSPNDDTTAGIAIYLVRTALQRWEPRVEIRDLNAGPDPQDPAVLVISLKYQVRMTRTNDEIQISLNLAGEER